MHSYGEAFSTKLTPTFYTLICLKGLKRPYLSSLDDSSNQSTFDLFFFFTEEYQSDVINTNGGSHLLGFNQIILRDFQKGFNNSYTLLSIFISSVNRWNIAEDRTINRNKIKLENYGGLCKIENLKSCCVVTHEHMRIKATDVSKKFLPSKKEIEKMNDTFSKFHVV